MRDVIVLCYHAVSDRWPADLSVTPSQLEAQVRFLLGRGYRAAVFNRAVTAPPAAKTFAVTFDDGFHSTYRAGFAVLSRLGVPASVFVVTDFVDERRPLQWPGIDQWLGGTHEQELLPASWDELRELAAAGWEVGSHTCAHPYLTRCDAASLERELERSRQRCEQRLDIACRSLAYPYGDVDQRVQEAAARAGYLAAAALPDRSGEPTRLAWPRIGVWHGDSAVRFRVKVSPGFRAVRGSAVWNAVLASRRLCETNDRKGAPQTTGAR